MIRHFENLKNKNIMKMKKKWSGFLTNLLGVILGIALTFGGSAIWQKREERKKTREILILVRNELKVNKEWFQNQEKHMDEDIDVYKKMMELKGGWKSVPQDTITTYLRRIANIYYSPLFSSAWQIFQNSEMIQKINDKELIIRLTECYFWIHKIEQHIEREYWDKKVSALVDDVIVEHPYQYFEALMNKKESAAFYAAMARGNPLWNMFPIIDAIIDFNISLLDKYGNFTYDMEEKEKAYEAFVEARVDSVRLKKNAIEND